MNTYMTEEEQVEQIKKLWSKYGNHLLTVLLVIIVAVQGYRWYTDRQLSISSKASNAFSSLMSATAKNDKKSIEAKANYIKDNYPATVYASSSSLLVAKDLVESKKYDQAISELQWIIKHADSKSFQQLAKLRLARILLFQKKFQQAMSELDVVVDPLFLAMVHELKGDIFLAEGIKEKASEQYKLALSELPNPAFAPAGLRMKLNRVSDQASTLFVNQSLRQVNKQKLAS